ncbi:DUF3019 domain-containing protein [Paraglaciecola sp.]|uniref:DUF3019 domain-containing protein n=1 Tax=Paraglaciecola sp. TaxID=1920173 RepID=UPI0030F398A0
MWAATSLVPSDQTNELHIKPNTCVSLHQGQTCFVNLTISWNMANSNDYCLYSSAQPTPIKCWIASNQGVITQDFSAEQTLHFYLKLDKSNTVVAESELSISWVYKKQQKSRLTWRLF